jgi:hypothetical protein
MAETHDIVMRLHTLAARGASRIATRGALTSHHVTLGVEAAAGRQVYDTVTGQMATVVSSTVAYLPKSFLAEAKSG